MSAIKKSFAGRLLVIAAASMLTVAAAYAVPHQPRNHGDNHSRFVQINLVSDIPGLAAVTDPQLLNPWGITYGGTGPFWVSDNNSGFATLYTGAGTKEGLIVTIPPPVGGTQPATPTGQIFNGTTSFQLAPGKPALFILDTEDGTISGWNPGVSPTHAILTVDNSAAGAVYKGLAIGTVGANTYLYATNFRAARVEVYDTNFHLVSAPGAFVDKHIARGYAPFNITNLNGMLFVTYAVQDASKHDNIAGHGLGYVDVFDTSGNLLKRLVKHGKLNAPWGLAIAPEGFGRFTGALLVGNFGDGRIHAYDLNAKDRDDDDDTQEIGTIRRPDGRDVQIDGLWSLIVGNGGTGGDADKIYFTAGPNEEADGLLGSLALAP